MVKKIGITSFFFNSSETSQVSSSTSFSTAASWQWPSCTQARTRSFRCESPEIVSMRHQRGNEQDFKTSMNPAYLLEHSCSSLSDQSSEQSICTAPEEAAFKDAVLPMEDDVDEAIVRSLRSTNGRLFFEPESTSSIVVNNKVNLAFDGATALAIDSADPYGDFRRSMEEMVMSHGINDWGWLEEMLGWYLTANGKKTHGLIVGAFVDLLVALTSAPSPPTASSSAALLRPTGVKKGKRHQTDLTHCH